MIPKIIHYCWFGGKPLPEFAQRYIASWKTHCPDFELMLWNEDNFDVNMVPFTAQVAKAKKWGFIVDYIRAYVIYYYGGIYLDVDVELLRPFNDDMLVNKSFGGFEDERYVNPGNIFAGEKGCYIAKELMEFYAGYDFIKVNGTLNLTPSPKIFTNILHKHGLKHQNKYQNIGIFTAYPTEYFCPKSSVTGLLKITKNSITIHHFDASWYSSGKMKAVNMRYKIYSLFGDNIFSKFLHITTRFFHRFFMEDGPINTLRHYWRLVFHR